MDRQLDDPYKRGFNIDSRVHEMDNLRSEYRSLKAGLVMQGKRANARTIQASVLWCAFGAALGMTSMVYWYEQSTPHPAATVTTDQRVKELRFSLQKLERLKDVHDATLKTAATNQGDIRQMVKELGEVGK